MQTMGPVSCRCASVVAWLESMADDVLTAQVRGGVPLPGPAQLSTPLELPAGLLQSSPLFAEHEGVWLETQQRLGQGECLPCPNCADSKLCHQLSCVPCRGCCQRARP